MSLLTTLCTSAHELDGIPPKSIHAIFTSPPYYAVRIYHGEQGVEWPEVAYRNPFGGPDIVIPAMTAELGNEPTPEAYLGHMVLCLRRWWQVLRDDGVLVLNLGDSYVSSGNQVGRNSNLTGNKSKIARPPRKPQRSYKVKDIYAMPQRLALVAWAEGWYLRQIIPWLKRNAMPGLYDRFITSHEDIIVLTKRKTYYNDPVAIKRPPVNYKRAGGTAVYTANGSTTNGVSSKTFHQLAPDGRNARTSDVWFDSLESIADELEAKAKELRQIATGSGAMALTDDANTVAGFVVNTQAYAGQHFAAWPERLVELFVKMFTSEAGCCPTCGKQWVRTTKKTFLSSGRDKGKLYVGSRWRDFPHGRTNTDTTGWRQVCKCPPHQPIPSTCLDPFAGSGTTGQVAVRLGRRCILADISDTYLDDLVPARTNNLQIKLPTIE